MTLAGRPVGPGLGRDWLAWSGQHPGLSAGTVHANVTLGAATVVECGSPAVAVALAAAGAAGIDPGTVLGVSGEGLSGGQAQRVAAARALYRARANGCPVAVFDEPSSALDDAAEADLIEGLRRLAAEGRIVIVVSHRPAFRDAADLVVSMGEVARV
jgi:ATP-binding cassette subfamily C protein CydD